MRPARAAGRGRSPRRRQPTAAAPPRAGLPGR
jgi:hypothetical protein